MNKETKEYKETDKEYQEYTLADVKETDDQWTLKTDSGWYLCVKKVEGHTPETGQPLRFYGKGIGCTVRGVDIDGVNYYYKTPAQQEANHKKWCDDLDKERRESYEKNKDKYKVDYDGLPEVLQKRMDRLIGKSPDNRHEWEPYEIYILTESVKILDALKTPEKIESFKDMSFALQKSLVPSLDEGHSGNTFGCATRMAFQMADGITDL